MKADGEFVRPLLQNTAAGSNTLYVVKPFTFKLILQPITLLIGPHRCPIVLSWYTQTLIISTCLRFDRVGERHFTYVFDG